MTCFWLHISSILVHIQYSGLTMKPLVHVPILKPVPDVVGWLHRYYGYYGSPGTWCKTLLHISMATCNEWKYMSVCLTYMSVSDCAPCYVFGFVEPVQPLLQVMIKIKILVDRIQSRSFMGGGQGLIFFLLLLHCIRTIRYLTFIHQIQLTPLKRIWKCILYVMNSSTCGW